MLLCFWTNLWARVTCWFMRRGALGDCECAIIADKIVVQPKDKKEDVRIKMDVRKLSKLHSYALRGE